MKRTLRCLFFMLLFIGAADKEVLAQAQVGEIAGTILDDRNEPIIGAVIRVEQGGVAKGGAVTDFDGKYSVKPLQAGRYDVSISYIGMKPERVNGVIVSPSYTTLVDKKMKSSTELDAVVVVSTYQPPLIDKGKPGVSTTLTSEQIKVLPTRSTSDFASMSTGVYQRSSGGGVNIGGARGEGTLIIIDGIQVTGSRYINQAPDVIDQMQVITSGISAKYGDATGGVINITTRGISSNYRGGITAEHSVEGFNNNLVAFNISGPFASRRDEHGFKKPVIGFFLAGDYRYDKDPSPSYIGNWVVKDDVLADLQKNPLVARPNVTGVPSFAPRSEYVTKQDLVYEKVRRNASSQRASLTGKLDYELTPGTNITAGGSFFYTNGYNFSRSLALFSPEATSKTLSYTGRGYLRFTQSFKKPATTDENGERIDDVNTIQNAFYSVQADYQRDHSSVQDPNHKMDPFKYGYVGKFVEEFEPVYAPGVDDSTGKTAILLYGYQPTGVKFDRAELNPLLANYTSAYYDLGGEAPLLLSNIASAGAYLRNGDGPNSTYSLWSNVGTPQGSFNKQLAEQFSLGVDASFDYKMKRATHAIEFGMYYQQRSERFYAVGGSGLWSLMRLLTHRVVPFSEMDRGSSAVYIAGGQRYSQQDIKDGLVPFGPYDTVFYDRVRYDTAAPVGGFDYNLRQKLGLDPKGRDYLQPDAYDPSMYSLDMFTADELLNNGASLVNYFGYDYTGNMVTGPVNFNDFWTAKDENGNYTRPIGAYRPNYLAGYISDNITFKDIRFNIGVRVERFDNNTKVLKDPYNLYGGRYAGDVPGTLNQINNGAHPENIGSDYAVYVNDNASSSPSVIGYRKEDTWYDANGREISDPYVLRGATGGRDPQPYLSDPNGPRITDENYDPNTSFEDYKPQVNAMPRVSFSFPITDVALFYAHYDVIIQRPKPGLNGVLTGAGAFATPADYFFLTQNPSNIIGNPDLKPEKAINYEVGFQQKLTELSAITINGFYKERRDQIQIRPYVFAWPQTYFTYGNRDFSTTKGLGLKYELRRINHLAMHIAYTLQFADGTGSSTASGNSGGTGAIAAGGLLQYLVSAQLPNLMFTNALDYDSRHILNVNVDYRYDKGEGPVVAGKRILENAGANLLFQTRSGEPYTLLAQPQTLQGGVHNANVIIGQINGARLPWHYMVNLKVDKSFTINFNKKAEDGTVTQGRPYYLNVFTYIQNLLNTRDVLGVYRFTGRPDDDGYLTSSLGENVIRTQTDAQSFQDLYSLAMNNPGRYNLPRRITIGLQFNF